MIHPLSIRAFIICSYGMMLFSVVGLVIGVVGIYPKHEPKVILAISWLALLFSAYGNIISSQVNKKVEAIDGKSL